MGEWNFPSNNFGNLNGIGEAGIETFRGSPYTSLAREICQNSMDARLNNDEPTVVEFACTKIPTNSIPDYNNLRDAFDLCLEFWKEANIKKTVGFF